LPSDAPQTVTFTLTGYLPETDQLEVISTPGSTPQLRPNPVLAELQPAPPPRSPRLPTPPRPSPPLPPRPLLRPPPLRQAARRGRPLPRRSSAKAVQATEFYGPRPNRRGPFRIRDGPYGLCRLQFLYVERGGHSTAL